MSKREWFLFINDMLLSIKKIREYTANMSKSDFFSDHKTFDAVMRNLEIIGEASKNIPSSARKKNENIEWKKIAGFRDIVIHHYFGIDHEIIWDVVVNKIPELNNELKKILPE